MDMPGIGDLVQKAFYLGVGMASYAGERAGKTFGELRSQAQKIADEMVARGEMTTEEARKMVDEMVNRAQKTGGAVIDVQAQDASREPRSIEIDDMDEGPASSASSETEKLRQQVANLQDELKKLNKN
jgi:polyhydroxyalkanoate synthesis regulator phasin